MLSLREIVKTYVSGDSEVHALQGVSIDFRESEFVSILGPSGCGKTTMLNIIGGLDRYTSGDLIINGRSTKEYRDADWDTYRNHSIGFVFQSYNLIMHQTVLANVELALTLSGVSREERRQRAIDALEQVGLGDQIHKKPNQMSGGQMQRVAIARALVNDPDILLADEPTGALDTATSVQIMEILKKVSQKKLIIMVTHNPELAEQYSNRIIRVLDGQVQSDSNPYEAPRAELEAESAVQDEEVKPAKKQKQPKKAKKSADGKGKKSMSFLTALSLSFTNLLTKKTRTLLVSIAGSIGIIGIALILALSNGVNLFIASVQEETLTSYPVSITAQTSDYAAMLSAMVGTSDTDRADRDPNKIYVDDSISNMVGAMTTMKKNNLADFNRYLLSRYDEISNDLTAIQYSYSTKLQIFNASTQYGKNGVLQVSPSKILTDFSAQNAGLSAITDSISIFSEIMPGKKDANGKADLINPAVMEQYNIIDGRWPQKANELVLVVDKNNTVANITLYMLGMLNPDEMTAMMASMMMGEPYDAKTEGMSFTYEDFYKLDLNLAYNSDFYTKLEGAENSYVVDGETLQKWSDLRDNADFLPETVYDNGIKLKIVGVIAPNPDASSTSISGSIAYTSALTEAVLSKVGESEIAKQQVKYSTHDVFTGLPFKIDDAETLSDAQKKEKLQNYFNKLSNAEKAAMYMAIRTNISDAEMNKYLASINTELPALGTEFGIEDPRREFLINLYAFNSENVSLEKGTFANKAIAVILHAVDSTYSVAEYEELIASPEYSSALAKSDKDPVVVKKDGAGAEIYRKYAGLIDTLFDTPEKMKQRFEHMTAMTIRSVYPMIEGVNMQKDLLTAHMLKQNELLATKMQKIQYLVGVFCATNGISMQNAMTDPVASAYMSSLIGYTDVQIAEKFNTTVQQTYMMQLMSDATFKETETVALFSSYLNGLTEAEYAALYVDYMVKSDSTYDENLIEIGANTDDKALSAINIYPINFEAKERLGQIIKDYNATKDNEDDHISYTDIVAIMMSSVTIIVDAISYVLIAFVSISLVVSSIMIGIITYISVLERTKEIGILRAIGASKKDISRVFNAETLIIGFAAGAIGIITTLLLCLPINAILKAVTDMENIRAVLPVGAAFILVGISMLLTLIAGIIPSRIAAKKDPVEALRSE